MRSPRLSRAALAVTLATSLLAGPVLAQQDPALPAATAEVTGEAPIAAGNVAGARERAMNEAFRQLVEQAFGALVSEEAGGRPAEARTPALAALRAGWLQRPKRLVRNYRVLEQTEAGGYVRVRLTAELDLLFMRREIDRARAGTAAPVPRGVLPVVVSGPAEAGTAMVAALRAAGLAAEAQAGPSTSEPELRALARAGRGAVLLLSARAIGEGPVRGAGQRSVECHLGARVIPAAATRAPQPERAATARGFESHEAAARATCFGRVAAELAPSILPDIGVVLGGAPGERVLALDLDATEPAAIAALLPALRRVGGVSSTEIRRIVVGRVEVRIMTRLSTQALLAALGRELASVAVLVDPKAEGDQVKAQLRLAATTPEVTPEVIPGPGESPLPPSEAPPAVAPTSASPSAGPQPTPPPRTPQ